MIVDPDARGIIALAMSLGGEVSGDKKILCPGPGHSAKDRSLSILLTSQAPEGFVVHSFASDDPIACRDYVRLRLGLNPRRPTRRKPDSRAYPDTAVSVQNIPDNSQRDSLAAVLRIWRESRDPRGTLVERYLASRFLDLGVDVTQAIRFHSSLPYDGKHLPAMVALMRDFRTDEPCGVLRTWLDSRGRKVARRMLGRAKGAGVKLDESADISNALTIGEGIETCLTARQFGCGPVWALGSVGGVQTFPILSGIEVLNILAECDDAGASSRAIEVTTKRWMSADREVFIYVPPAGDLNDALINYRTGQLTGAGC